MNTHTNINTIEIVVIIIFIFIQFLKINKWTRNQLIVYNYLFFQHSQHYKFTTSFKKLNTMKLFASINECFEILIQILNNKQMNKKSTNHLHLFVFSTLATIYVNKSFQKVKYDENCCFDKWMFSLKWLDLVKFLIEQMGRSFFYV